MPECSPTKPGIDAFHRERSKCVDAFADLEAAVIAMLVFHKVKTGSEPFSQKLVKIAKIPPCPQLSKSQVSRLGEIVKRCQTFSEVRNDIVHSRLKLAVIDNDHRACFINHGQASGCIQNARLFNLQSLRDLSSHLASLTAEITDMTR